VVLVVVVTVQRRVLEVMELQTLVVVVAVVITQP
jgi:hypothetical protein